MLLFGLQNLTVPMILTILLAALIGMTVHEFAHSYVAYLMGDPTPKEQGRLTLDPGVHIYWPGFIMFVLIGFGILGSAPVNPYRMKNPRWGYLAAVAAGPFSNLLLAILVGLLFRFLPDSVLFETTRFTIRLSEVGFSIYLFMTFNLFLFLFNLLPFQPLDGWSIVFTLLPPDQARWWQRNAQNTQYIFLGLILLSFAAGSFLPEQFNLLGLILNDVSSGIAHIITGVGWL